MEFLLLPLHGSRRLKPKANQFPPYVQACDLSSVQGFGPITSFMKDQALADNIQAGQKNPCRREKHKELEYGDLSVLF